MSVDISEFIHAAEELGKKANKEKFLELQKLLKDTKIDSSNYELALKALGKLNINYAVRLLSDKWLDIHPELHNYFLRWLFDGESLDVAKKCIMLAAWLSNNAVSLEMIEQVFRHAKGKANEEMKSTIRNSWLTKLNDQGFPFESFCFSKLNVTKRKEFISLLANTAIASKSGGSSRHQEDLFAALRKWINHIVAQESTLLEEKTLYQGFLAKLQPIHDEAANAQNKQSLLSQDLQQASPGKEKRPVDSLNEKEEVQSPNMEQATTSTLVPIVDDGLKPLIQYSKIVQTLISENKLSVFLCELAEEITKMKKRVQVIIAESDKTNQQLKHDLSSATADIMKLKEQLQFATEESETKTRKMHFQLVEMTKEKEKIQRELDRLENKLQKTLNEQEQIKKDFDNHRQQSLKHTENVIQHELQMRSKEISAATSHIIKDFEEWKRKPDLPDPVAYLSGLFDSLLGVLSRYDMIIDRGN